MTPRLRLLAALVAAAVGSAAWADDATTGMKKGTPTIKQAGALAFGPDGVLFVADAPNSTVYAIATGDT
jgi:sugar lactone lactonase YvrE